LFRAPAIPFCGGVTSAKHVDVRSGSKMGRELRRLERFGPTYASPIVHERGGSCEIVIAGNTELAGS
jgi:hypothetical protein